MVAFRCPACKTVLQAEDAESGSRIRCTQCNRLLDILRAAAGPASPRPRATAASPVSAMAPGAIAPVTANEPWYCTVDGERHGPMDERAVYKLIDRDDLRPSDLVWKQGWPDWKPAKGYFEFPRPKRRSSRRDDDDDDGDMERPDQDGAAGTVCGILSIVCGVVALLFCPVVLGIAGIVLGSVSMSISRSKTLGIIGLVVSIIGLIAGVALGIWVMAKLMQNG